MKIKNISFTSIQLVVFSGILTGLSYPPIPGFTIWFAFIPIIHIWITQKPKESFKLTFLYGIVSNLIAFYWIGLNSGASLLAVILSLLGAVLYLSFFCGCLGFSVSWMENKQRGLGLVAIPFIWVSMEFLRSFGPLGFPWANLAITQTKFLPLVQIIDFTGSEGVGFIIMIFNTFLYKILFYNSINKKNIILLMMIILIPVLYGTIRINYLNNQNWDYRNISAIQPNIDPNQKWDPSFRKTLYGIMDSLNTEAYNLNPDLVLWPEAALPAYVRVSSIKNKYQKKVYESSIPLLMGTVDFSRDSIGRNVYNGSIFFGLDGIKMYHKIFLVPFAEYIPLSDKINILKKLNFGQANFTHGSDYVTFPLDSIYFSNMICYESSHPKVAKGFIDKGARFLTIQANDAWLRNSSGVRQHFELAKLRSIELRTGIVRSANTGISGIIDPIGNTNEKIGFNKQSVFHGKILLNKGLTFYAKYGSVFAKICLGFVLFQGILLLRRQ